MGNIYVLDFMINICKKRAFLAHARRLCVLTLNSSIDVQGPGRGYSSDPEATTWRCLGYVTLIHPRIYTTRCERKGMVLDVSSLTRYSKQDEWLRTSPGLRHRGYGSQQRPRQLLRQHTVQESLRDCSVCDGCVSRTQRLGCPRTSLGFGWVSGWIRLTCLRLM